MLTAVYILLTFVTAGLIFGLRGMTAVRWVGWGWFALQAGFLTLASLTLFSTTDSLFFTFDGVGRLMSILLAVISPLVYGTSIRYLDTETPRQKKLYFCMLILLCMCLTCVYMSNNLAITWVFLEGTTLCSAGLIYHRRNKISLEATWKYIFVCSVGITIAYLGILLIGASSQEGNMGYASLAAGLATANPLYMKIAFVLILVGYSCKLEIFPLYTTGVDANHSAPSPASAIISTGLVNAGFVALYRIYVLMESSPIFEWVRSTLLAAGLLSLLVSAMFMRRTNRYKRLLAYSTVENMGIAVIGLALGGIGITAAFIHMAGHALLKSVMFLQIAAVGKTYGNYRIDRSGNYMEHSPGAAAMLIFTTVMLLGFPPSPLFVSEVLMFSEMAARGQWWLLAVIVAMLCIVLYNFGRHIFPALLPAWVQSEERYKISGYAGGGYYGYDRRSRGLRSYGPGVYECYNKF